MKMNPEKDAIQKGAVILCQTMTTIILTAGVDTVKGEVRVGSKNHANPGPSGTRRAAKSVSVTLR